MKDQHLRDNHVVWATAFVLVGLEAGTSTVPLRVVGVILAFMLGFMTGRRDGANDGGSR